MDTAFIIINIFIHTMEFILLRYKFINYIQYYIYNITRYTVYYNDNNYRLTE